MMNKSQADIAYGFTTIQRNDPRYYACSLMNNILGQYAMGGRLGDSIRERQGMAYYVSTAFDAGLIEGPLMVRAGVSPANVDRAIASIDEELVRDPQRRGHRERARRIAPVPDRLDAARARDQRRHRQLPPERRVLRPGLDFDVRLPDHLRRVTRDEINEVARTLLDPDRATVVIAGPYRDSLENEGIRE